MSSALHVGRVLVLAFLAANATAAGDFLAGVDASHLRFFEDRGIVYREAGQVRDAFAILRKRGVNCVRLRLFTSSAAQAQADPYNRINNLEYTIPLAVRAKQAELQLLLDFHYSDTWADPGKQSKPTAWADLPFAALEQRMLEYNSNSIATTTNLSPPAAWSSATNDLQTTGLNFETSLPLGDEPGRFFRLHLN